MTKYQNDSELLREYRQKAKALGEIREQVREFVEQSTTTGDPKPLRSAFDALADMSLRTEELQVLRATLGPRGELLVRYGVEVLGEHSVSFVIPKSTRRIEILWQVRELHPDLFARTSLKRWQSDPRFQRSGESGEKISIDGRVEGTEGLSREQTELHLSSRSLCLPSLEDLAVAFALFYVATQNPLFGWCDSRRAQTHFIRAAGKEAALTFAPIDGLKDVLLSDDDCESGAAAAARID